MKNVNWNRAMKDRKDYKRYEDAFLGFLMLTVFTGIGIGLLGMLMAALG
jgi:hypothetical protein